MMVQFKQYDCYLLFSEYANNGNTSIQLVDARDGLPVATATINPGFRLPQNAVAIKNYSENEGVLNALIDGGIVSAPFGCLQIGNVTVPVCQLLVSVFEEEGVEA